MQNYFPLTVWCQKSDAIVKRPECAHNKEQEKEIFCIILVIKSVTQIDGSLLDVMRLKHGKDSGERKWRDLHDNMLLCLIDNIACRFHSIALSRPVPD